jgi:hypothetical protein
VIVGARAHPNQQRNTGVQPRLGRSRGGYCRARMFAGQDPREFGMRLKSAIWVAAYIRRCHIEGAFAAVRRRGAEEAGAIFVKLNLLDGTAELFGPAPQSAFDDARPTDRLFSRCFGEQPAPEAKVEERLARELRFDPDVWIVEVEDRTGRHFLDQIVA